MAKKLLNPATLHLTPLQYLLEWRGCRRLYVYAMTENMKSIIRRWHAALFTEDVKRKLGITERQVGLLSLMFL